MASADTSLSAPRISHDPSAPDPTTAAPPPNADALDDLFNYDANMDSIFGDVNPSAQRTNAREGQNTGAHGLGIDEEIKIRKPRKRAAKLDEERLLSEQGIPKLRRITKSRLKFRGKGHEFSDVSRLLTTYQLWLDDMFPKAKFGDGLALIEKLGHKKRLQVMRKAWIDEEKHKPESYNLSDGDDGDADGDFVMPDRNREEQADSRPGNDDETILRRDHDHDQEESDHEDLYRAPTPSPMVKGANGEPEGDELDALLAEDVAQGSAQFQSTRKTQTRDMDDFADEEDAMAGMW